MGIAFCSFGLMLFSLFLLSRGRVAGSQRLKNAAIWIGLIGIILFQFFHLHGGSVRQVDVDQLARIKHVDDFWRVGPIRITIPPDWETRGMKKSSDQSYGLRAGRFLSDDLDGVGLGVLVQPARSLIGDVKNKCVEFKEPVQKVIAEKVGGLPEGGEMVESRMGSIDACRFDATYSDPKFGSVRMVVYVTSLQEQGVTIAYVLPSAKFDIASPEFEKVIATVRPDSESSH